jgi:2-polyprenyl-6-methoxyphenol hydroxylase-like FAD-dependent oxidoreductase
MLWRGLLPEGALDDSTLLEGNIPRLSYAHMQGNMVIYFVPSENGETEPGRRLVNWAAYIPLPEDELDDFMQGSDGRMHDGTIPPGHMRSEEEQRLKRMMEENLPEYYASIVSKTSGTYVQLIYTAEVPSYHRARICLIGDAGVMVQPFTGSGVFKGHRNIRGLLRALEDAGTLDTALEYWDAEQLQTGRRLLALGDQMEQAYIWKPLDLAMADGSATSAWWKRSVTFPDEFTYETEELEQRA